MGQGFSSGMNNSSGRVVEAFATARREGHHPRLDDYLPADPAERQALLSELVRLDLEWRLAAGIPASVKDYLKRYPELKKDAQAVLELVELECRSRLSLPKEPSRKRILPRFSNRDLAQVTARWAAVYKLRSGCSPLTEPELKTVLAEFREAARVAKPRSLRKVAEIMGVSKERIRQIEMRVLERTLGHKIDKKINDS